MIRMPEDLQNLQPFEGYEFPTVVQKPRELQFLIDTLIKNNVKTLVCIGVMYGGVEWHIARKFKEAGMPISITAVEYSPLRCMEERYEEIKNIFKQDITVVVKNSLDKDLLDFLPKQVDAVFIDGDHRYTTVKHDFENAKKISNIILFHDIVRSEWFDSEEVQVWKLWNEIIEAGYKNELYVDGGNWGGVGVVYK